MIPLINRVEAIIVRLAPHPICDACLADKLDLAAAQSVNKQVRELAGQGGFERRRDICSLCFGEKVVTRHRTSAA